MRFYRLVRSLGSAKPVATPRDVLQDSLASVSPCGDERAAGPTRFLSLGRVLCVSGVFIVALGLGGGWGLQRHRGPGRRSASASIAATPRRRAVGSLVRVGGRRRCARAPWVVFSLPLRVEVHIVASQCWKTVRVRPSVCSPARLGGSLVICCALRAVGRRLCVARGPSSCGGRGTSWWALRTGRLCSI